VILFLASTFLWLAWPPAQAVTQESGSSQELLKKRVQEFYSLLQRQRLTEAESYVTPETLESFRSMGSNPFLGFEVESIQMEDGGKSASVLVQILYQAPQLAKPVKFPRRTTWRFDEGTWRLVVPEPAPPPLRDSFSADSMKTEQPKPADLHFQDTSVSMGDLKEGDKKQIRFSFTNVSNHPVTITAVHTDCPCLLLKSEKKTYQPGETGELILEFDSNHYTWKYKQTVVVITDPGSLRTDLLVEGYIQPRPASAAEPRGLLLEPDSASYSGYYAQTITGRTAPDDSVPHLLTEARMTSPAHDAPRP
jgi:hypothetical protein